MADATPGAGRVGGTLTGLLDQAVEAMWTYEFEASVLPRLSAELGSP